ncbi:hypothetical protein AGDE_04345 [Angomonas deanei]|nr:hypothetical protein AGDE_04345 [Angomonas deanei]|eukprot:EPY39583.1 hypothetical protein AGDE_04345 [Angomonas deanei]
MYSHNSCCLAGYDQEIKAAYSNIIPGGPRCDAGSQVIYTSLYDLLRYLCLPCNPEEPSFRFETAVGDVAEGGVIAPIPGAAAGEYAWRICKSFLYGAPGSNEGIWGNGASQYDRCGIKINTCVMTPSIDAATLTVTEPSPSCTPETDIVIPSTAFASSTDPALDLLTRIAQTFADFQIVVVDDYDPLYDRSKTPCFGHNAAQRIAYNPFITVLLLTCLLFF